MKHSQRVVVIGAGVIGLSLAWQLAALGARVTVVEADRPGAGTSSTSFAWANASSKIEYGNDYFVLNSLALQEHHSLMGKVGTAGWLHTTGDIEIASDAAEAAALARKVEALRNLGYAAKLLTSPALQDLEPGTRCPSGGGAAFYEQEGWVDVPRMVSYLLGAGAEAGVTLVTADRVTEVLRQGSAATGVRLASGAVLAADVVVTALGRWTPAFAAALQLAVPLVDTEAPGSKAVGLLARIEPTGGMPRRLLHSREVNWSPLPDGRALIASDAGDAAVARGRSPEAAAAAARDLVEKAAALNPLFEGARIENPQIGLRALPSDGEAICGWAEAVGSLYVVATHSGVTLAPLLGRLAAREIVEGTLDPLLGRFRLDRFAAREHDEAKMETRA